MENRYKSSPRDARCHNSFQLDMARGLIRECERRGVNSKAPRPSRKHMFRQRFKKVLTARARRRLPYRTKLVSLLLVLYSAPRKQCPENFKNDLEVSLGSSAALSCLLVQYSMDVS